MEMAYEFFADTMKGDAMDNWLKILQHDQVYEVDVRDAMSWAAHIAAFRDIFLDPKAYDDQKEYLRSTKKLQNMSVKNWIKRIMELSQK